MKIQRLALPFLVVPILFLVVASVTPAISENTLTQSTGATPVVLSPNKALLLLNRSLRSLSLANAKEEVSKKYQEIYTISDHFVVKDGYVADGSAKDGPVNYQFQATALQPGYYIFTFENLDGAGWAYETRKVRLIVTEKTGKSPHVVTNVTKLPTPPTRINISPSESAWKTYSQGLTLAKPQDDIVVSWQYYYDGEGITGGWELSKIEFTNDPRTKIK